MCFTTMELHWLSLRSCWCRRLRYSESRDLNPSSVEFISSVSLHSPLLGGATTPPFTSTIFYIRPLCTTESEREKARERESERERERGPIVCLLITLMLRSDQRRIAIEISREKEKGGPNHRESQVYPDLWIPNLLALPVFIHRRAKSETMVQ